MLPTPRPAPVRRLPAEVGGLGHLTLLCASRTRCAEVPEAAFAALPRLAVLQAGYHGPRVLGF
jgi:hypothetical protein